MKYFLGCESCPEFIEADLVKYMDEFNELVGNCKVLVWNKYNITEDMALNIVVEGIENKWIMPEVSLPDCCGSISESTVIFDPITITGSGSEKSAPFTVTTSEWIIEWEYEPEPEYSDMAVIGFFIYPRGETTMGIEAIVPGSETSGSSYSYAGPGDYYVDVQAAGVLSWKIQIKPA